MKNQTFKREGAEEEGPWGVRGHLFIKFLSQLLLMNILKVWCFKFHQNHIINEESDIQGAIDGSIHILSRQIIIKNNIESIGTCQCNADICKQNEELFLISPFLILKDKEGAKYKLLPRYNLAAFFQILFTEFNKKIIPFRIISES